MGCRSGSSSAADLSVVEMVGVGSRVRCRRAGRGQLAGSGSGHVGTGGQPIGSGIGSEEASRASTGGQETIVGSGFGAASRARG